MLLHACTHQKLIVQNGPTYVKFNIINKNKTEVFKTSIDISKKHFSGISIIKKKDTISKVVFINELGMRIFEFEYNMQNGKFNINYILDAINKKIIIKTLREDFRMLLQTFTPDTKQKIYISKNKKYFYKKI